MGERGRTEACIWRMASGRVVSKELSGWMDGMGWDGMGVCA